MLPRMHLFYGHPFLVSSSYPLFPDSDHSEHVHVHSYRSLTLECVCCCNVCSRPALGQADPWEKYMSDLWLLYLALDRV